MIVAHVTHEAVEQMGGIGTVISGLVNSEAYGKVVKRTVLLGPLLATDRPVNLRLGEGGRVLYSSLDAIDPPPWRDKFRPIEKTYDVGIIYGYRQVLDACTGKSSPVEVIVVDVFHANRDRLNLFKAELYNKFAIPSQDFEKIWEYEQYVRLAEPGFEALKAIGADGNNGQIVLLAHEYMGMPTALKSILAGAPNTRTVFYAHEVASVRPIVEDHPGHDTMFYNLLPKAKDAGKTIEDIFPQVRNNYKHPLVKAARYCDHIFAVGDYVQEELRFLDPHFSTMNIDLVYNGVPAERITFDERNVSRSRLMDYAHSLLGRRPTWLFTHVCRPVLSKGIWRDLRVLHEMEAALAGRGETAVYFMLGTLAGQRRLRDIRQMERVYGWPVAHERGYPDLCGGEEVLGSMFDSFNREHRAIRAVLVNQWGWSQQVCGDRMPPQMTFADLRRGADVEFGMSTYEPFGISPFEPLTFGAVCVTTDVCGCMGYARCASGDAGPGQNILESSFLQLPKEMGFDELLGMSISQRDGIETAEAKRLGGILLDRLTYDPAAMRARIDSGFRLAKKMSWDRVVEDYFLPALSKVAEH